MGSNDFETAPHVFSRELQVPAIRVPSGLDWCDAVYLSSQQYIEGCHKWETAIAEMYTLSYAQSM